MKEKLRSKGLQKFKDLAVPILIYVLVIAILIFTVNQFLEFKYRAEFLSKPCSVCCKLNEGFSCDPKIIVRNTIPAYPVEKNYPLT